MPIQLVAPSAVKIAVITDASICSVHFNVSLAMGLLFIIQTIMAATRPNILPCNAWQEPCRSKYYLPKFRLPLKRPFLGHFEHLTFPRHKVGLSSGETPTFPVINSELAGRVFGAISVGY